MAGLTRTLLFPGQMVSDLRGAGTGDDRMMIRTLVNMLVWNLLVVIAVVLLY